MPKKMKCPNCGRRAFDISEYPKEKITITLKCPQCRKFVTVICAEESSIREVGMYIPLRHRERNVTSR